MSARDLFCALAVVFLWGTNFVAVKVTLTILPPFLMTSVRFALVALVLAPFWRPRPEQLPGIIGIGAVLGCGHFGLMFWALSSMDAATAVITTQLGTPLSALLAWLVFREKLGLVRAAGMALAFVGVGLLAGEPGMDHPAILLVTVASMSCWAISNVQVKRLGHIDPIALNGWTSIFSSIFLLILSLLTEHGQGAALVQAMGDWPTIAGVAYSVIGSSIIAYTLWYRLLARNSMNHIVPLTMLNPVVGMIGGITLLGEPLSWQKVVGGTVTLAGVAVIQMLGSNRPSRGKPESGK